MTSHSIDLNLMTKVQSEIRRHLMKKRLIKLRKKAKLRMKALQEMLSTEETYSERLSMCVELFVKPLFLSITNEKKKNKKFVDEQEFRTIFQNIEALADYHSKEILVSLRERLGHLLDTTKSQDQNTNKATKQELEPEKKIYQENQDQDQYQKKKEENNIQDKKEDQKKDQKEKNEKEKEKEANTNENKKEKENEFKEESKKKEGDQENQNEKEEKTLTYEELVHKTRLGKCFQGFKVIVRLYGDYCEGYEEGLKLLANLRAKKEKFSNWLLEVKSLPEAGNLDITSYLIMPIQRLPRYTLLLSEALKHTDPLHPDYAPTKEAMGFIEKIAQKINEHLNVLESQRELYELQSNVLGWNVVKPNRKLLLELPVNKVNPYGSIQKRYLFLFSDVIIWASKSLGKFRMKKFITTNTCWIQEMPSFPKFPNMFLIVGKKQTVTICALTQKDKLLFFGKFSKYVDTQTQSNQKYRSERVNAKLRKKIINLLAVDLSMFKILKKLSPPKVGAISDISVFGESAFKLKVQSNNSLPSGFGWNSQKNLRKKVGISSQNFNFGVYSNDQKKISEGMHQKKLSKIHSSTPNIQRKGHVVLRQSVAINLLNELKRGKNLPPLIPKKLDNVEKIKRLKKITKIKQGAGSEFINTHRLIENKQKYENQDSQNFQTKKENLKEIENNFELETRNNVENDQTIRNEKKNDNENDNENDNDNDNDNGYVKEMNVENIESPNFGVKNIDNNLPPPLPKRLDPNELKKRLKNDVKKKGIEKIYQINSINLKRVRKVGGESVQLEGNCVKMEGVNKERNNDENEHQNGEEINDKKFESIYISSEEKKKILPPPLPKRLEHNELQKRLKNMETFKKN
ncbi:faciogenital dysplasia protein [Anaeramoeba flamelloides]|uniref:Faciogenital dysplasia protein n=1 Tax=Anaeramoeba flamelloides TaxID=1746091 RepID=A0AAV7YWA5_9EUKA|nr:faciogenital dysplasia protein [Anaeramoeba flamelloides]